ncbi:WGR domain-containing protein [Acidihalobacter prosperus]|uniref:WGR domain-containing protein n=1 Tax=Acidihalobacter prosperus TaxID=160660 RepID=UPI00050474D7|nr:WGR domain-containing protein [Acidihalobacter prosperus]
MERVLIYDKNGSDKFWAVLVRNSTCYVFWGANGTKGQVKTYSFSSPYKADVYARAKVDEKTRKGYGPAVANDPNFDQERFFDEKFLEHGVLVGKGVSEEPPANPGRSVAWFAPKPITIDHLNDAVTLVNTVLNTAGLAPCIHLTPEGQVTFSAVDDDDLHFGYPPQAFIDGLIPTARKALIERDVSRDGWLSINGVGSGTLEYGESLHQLTVPLFLAVLIRNAGGFSAVDGDNGKLGICLDWDRIKIPQGYPKENLVRAVREHWFTNDTKVRILEDANTSECVYW